MFFIIVIWMMTIPIMRNPQLSRKRFEVDTL
jgi:hypothetical protein